MGIDQLPGRHAFIIKGESVSSEMTAKCHTISLICGREEMTIHPLVETTTRLVIVVKTTLLVGMIILPQETTTEVNMRGEMITLHLATGEMTIRREEMTIRRGEMTILHMTVETITHLEIEETTFPHATGMTTLVATIRLVGMIIPLLDETIILPEIVVMTILHVEKISLLEIVGMTILHVEMTTHHMIVVTNRVATMTTHPPVIPEVTSLLHMKEIFPKKTLSHPRKITSLRLKKMHNQLLQNNHSPKKRYSTELI